jgi:hypothetical protein
MRQDQKYIQPLCQEKNSAMSRSPFEYKPTLTGRRSQLFRIRSTDIHHFGFYAVNRQLDFRIYTDFFEGTDSAL